MSRFLKVFILLMIFGLFKNTQIYAQGVLFESSLFSADITSYGDLFRLTEGSLSLEQAKEILLNQNKSGLAQEESLYALVISKVSTKDLETWLEEELKKEMPHPISRIIVIRLASLDPKKTWDITIKSKLPEQKVLFAQIILYEWQKKTSKKHWMHGVHFQIHQSLILNPGLNHMRRH